MKLTVDTNILVRVFTNDDPVQNRSASRLLDEADAVVLATSMLCELAWVLRQGYGSSSADVADVVRRLVDTENAISDGPAVEAGLAMLAAGGDFADGVIAHEGRRLGSDAFVSFDRKAVRLLTAAGEAARLAE